MERIWRWFGENDKVTLQMLRQIGIEKLIAAPQNVSVDNIWTLEQISNLKYQIEDAGLKWTIAGDLAISNVIRYGGDCVDRFISIVIENLANLGESGINSVCYNFAADSKVRLQQTEIGKREIKDNIRYFLSQLMPVCEEYNLRISFNPNYLDASLSKSDWECILNIVDNPYNGFTLNIDLNKEDIFDHEIEFAVSQKSRVQLLIINYIDNSTIPYQPVMILDKKKKNSLISLVRLLKSENPSLPVLLQPYSLEGMLTDESVFLSKVYMYAQLDGIISTLQHQ